MAHDRRAITAANNNADLYEAVFTAWGLSYERRSFAFVSQDRPPPYYSHLTVLAPGSANRLVPQLRALGDRFEDAISFKDSFCEFCARDSGIELLFEASWLWRAPQAASLPKCWVTVEDAVELEKWEAAWKRAGSPTSARIFKETMLGSADTVFLGKKTADEFVSGCIANRSSECVGISNVFSVTRDEGAFEEAAAAVASTNPSLPIAGYATGPQLDAAARSGFATTGPLRVLKADWSSRFLPLSNHCGL